MSDVDPADPVSGIAAEIARRPVNGRRLIGVDGPSGSGKSTLAQRLAQLLAPSTLLWLDDFVSWPDFSGWWGRFDEQLLTPLLTGSGEVRYQVRDWRNDEFGSSLGPWKTARPAPTIVLDGVTCTRLAVSERLTYAIWVQAAEPVRLARGIARDGESHRQLWLDWMATEAAFFARDGTKARADSRFDTTHGGYRPVD